MGLGSASNKKDAETNAAKDFCGFLIGAGIIPPDSFPDDLFVSFAMATTRNMYMYVHLDKVNYTRVLF